MYRCTDVPTVLIAGTAGGDRLEGGGGLDDRVVLAPEFLDRRPRGWNGSRVYIGDGMHLPYIPTPPLLTTECIDRLKSDAYPRLLVRGFRPPAADQDQEAVSLMFGDNADY